MTAPGNDIHTRKQMATTPSLFPDPTREIFFDIETLRLSHEVEGGWSNIARFGLAVAVTWDAQSAFRRWFEQDAKALITEMGQFDRIVSFNGDRFDFEVLRAYHPVDQLMKKSFDLLVDLHRRLGYRIKLDDLARETLGNRKPATDWKSSSGGARAARKKCASIARMTCNCWWT